MPVCFHQMCVILLHERGWWEQAALEAFSSTTCRSSDYTAVTGEPVMLRHVVPEGSAQQPSSNPGTLGAACCCFCLSEGTELVFLFCPLIFLSYRIWLKMMEILQVWSPGNPFGKSGENNKIMSFPWWILYVIDHNEEHIANQTGKILLKSAARSTSNIFSSWEVSSWIGQNSENPCLWL